jgi:uncharacterized protein (TIGR03437 family)
MTQNVLRAAMFCALAGGLRAQPGIGQNGVVNAASEIPPTLPGGSIARSARFIIRGVHLGSLGHTLVTVSRNGATTPVKILGINNWRIDALMPPSAPLGSASLVVSVDGKASKAFHLEVSAFNPGLFSRNGEGWGPGRIDNIDPSGAHIANSETNPAHPGKPVALFATGIGDAKQVTVIVGNRAGKTLSIAATAQPGEAELTVQIPADAPHGCYVPVYILADPARASNVVSIFIAGAGTGQCDPGPLPLLMTATRIGLVFLTHTSLKPPRKDAEDMMDDEARVTFAGKNQLPLYSLFPPPGTCTMFTSSFQSTTNAPNSINTFFRGLPVTDLYHTSTVSPEGLEAGGTLEFKRGAQVRSLSQMAGVDGSYRGNLGLGGSAARRGAFDLFFGTGDVELKGTGGKDIGAFTAYVSNPSPFEWTDRSQITVVDRSRGVKVHWRNAAKHDFMLILAGNIDQITTASAYTGCLAHAAAGEFEIPAVMLANLPATQDIPGVPYERLFLASVRQSSPGIPTLTAAAISVYAIGRIVEFR